MTAWESWSFRTAGDRDPGQPDGVRRCSRFAAREAFGGVLLGLATGYVAYRMLKSVDSYQVEVMVTLALVTGVTLWP